MRNKKYHIITFGCAMNKLDSERAARVLESLGYQGTSNFSQADLVLINACSVRQSAIDRVYAKAKIIENLKKKKKITALLTGCILNEDRQKFSNFFDLIFNIKDLENLPNFLNNLDSNIKIVPQSPLFQQVKKIKETSQLSPEEESYLKIYPKRQNSFTALIAISNGCNKFCTFCAVPYTRGLEVNRPAEEIIKECQKAIEEGAKEIVLLGQTVNSYKDKKGTNFANLLREINNLEGKFWISFQSPYPTEFTDDIVLAIAQCQKVQKYANLPLQSGDNNVLKKMNRRYTIEQYKEVVKKIRKLIPNFCLATDIIVGFPGEGEKEFQNTAQVMREIRYDMAYIARYSPRPGTVAEKYFKDDVSDQEKKRRQRILTNILKKSALEINLSYKGKIIEVLITTKKRNYLYGKSFTMKNVILPSLSENDEKLVGNFVLAKITEVFPLVLKGEIVDKF